MTAFPKYMGMGMSYDEYWNGPVWLAKAYREAWDERQRREEWARWRQGLYVYNALLCVAPVLRAFGGDNVRALDYLSEPLPITEKEVREREEAREKANYEAYIARMEAASDRELKRRAEEAKKEAVENGGH